MTLEDRILSLAQAIGLDIKAINNSRIKGFVTLNFVNSSEQKIAVANTNVNANTVISANIENTNDELFVEDFQLQIVKQIGVGFTIFCRPRIGNANNQVRINYLIE